MSFSRRATEGWRTTLTKQQKHFAPSVKRDLGNAFKLIDLFSSFPSHLQRWEGERARIKLQTRRNFFNSRSTLAGDLHFPGKEEENLWHQVPSSAVSQRPSWAPSSPSSSSRKSRLHFKCLAFSSLFLFLLDIINSADLGNFSSTFSLIFFKRKIKETNYIDV